MPDITMCNGELKVGFCPWMSSCYRFTAIPSEHQSYMAAPFNKDTKDCDFYLNKKRVKGDTQ